jgi:hypothetical protein
MESLTEKERRLGTASFPNLDLTPEFKRSGFKNINGAFEETERSKEYLNDTFSDNYKNERINGKKSKTAITETIREWWIGKVLEVHREEGYFVASLRDRNGIENIAEFDIESAFENDADVEYYLFSGSSFAFSVFTRHGIGAPETTSKIEFTTPHIWSEGDDLKLKELFSQLFPNDQPLED